MSAFTTRISLMRSLEQVARHSFAKSNMFFSPAKKKTKDEDEGPTLGVYMFPNGDRYGTVPLPR